MSSPPQKKARSEEIELSRSATLLERTGERDGAARKQRELEAQLCEERESGERERELYRAAAADIQVSHAASLLRH